jgi:hypothetical protein
MSVLATYATGAALAVLVAVGWVAVQGAWRRAFPDRPGDDDPMTGRLGCSGGLRSAQCARRAVDGTCGHEEERR